MTFRRSVLPAALALLMLLPSAGVRAGSNPDAQAALKRGLAALAKEDPRTARVELMNAIKADPALAAARVAQARALLMLGNGQGAQDELDRARQLGAAPGAIRHLLAHAALLQGRAQDAADLAQAADIDPRQAVFAARIAGQAYQALGQYDAAARAFDRALALAPNDAPLWADIGRFRIATGDMAAAVVASDRAVALAPRNSDTLVLRALLVREQYGLVASFPWFERALSVDRHYVPALIEYAATLSDAGRAGAALSLSRRALALAPGLPRAYMLQAVIAARAGDYDLARALLARTHGALDGQAATRLLRGVLHLQSGNSTLAIDQLAPVLDAQPLNLRVRLLLARAYAQDRQYDEAEKVLFPMVERADAGNYALILAARVQEALGHPDVAERFLTRAAAGTRGRSDVFLGAGTPGETAPDAVAAPASAAPNIRYIRALLQAREIQTALARAKDLVRVNMGAPAAHVVLGDCLMAVGRPDEAALVYQRAANIRFTEDVAFRLIDAWRMARRPDLAQQVLSVYLSQNPSSVSAQRLASAYTLGAGEAVRALPLLQGLQQRLGNNDALLMTNLAWAWMDRDDAEQALPYAAHAYRLNRASAVTSDVLGWALFRAREDKIAARDLLEKALAIAPNEPLVQLHLGQVYSSLGETGAARDLLNRAAQAKDFPRHTEALAALARL
ncbi:tetratricopeptide repeat protein [Sphingobium subterraneum]|uniref:Tetratricopeptide (TPR) repeat protein n=1 Tax=Sphingobium subterraneum TaxID=627688 RepID=A0A841J1I2_9SPHN|nr:tetratricopeptide repeat protein [Sphingobium subterraneum]MBB6124687.1 tetratricopeptide (TPR) repeat protein [Sphingobium subterraneum]